MAKRGIPARIDEAELEKLCSMQATDEELAAWFGVSTRTIERRRKSVKFSAIMERGKAKGRLSIRRMQIKLLESGNATMGVWLGKQYLGQADQVQHAIDFHVASCLALPRSMPRELVAQVIDTQSYGESEPYDGEPVSCELPELAEAQEARLSDLGKD